MENKLKQEISARKIDVLYRHSTIAILGMLSIALAAAIFVYFYIWPEDQSAQLLLIWLVMFFLVGIIRLYGIALYRGGKVSPAQANYWLYAYIAGSVTSGCLWGLFFLYLVGFADVDYRNFILFFMFALISTTVAAYATSLLAFFVAVSTIAGPVIIYFLIQADKLTQYMGYLLIVYLVFLIFIVRQLNNTLEQFLAHEFNLARVEQEKQYAKMLNRELEEEIRKRIHTEGKLKDEISKAEALADKLITISSKDGLTGINNRRRFDEYLVNEWNRAARSDIPLSLILCDIDSYKAYNDTYGHLAGDDCLKKIAHVLEHYARRASDLAARYGGEEFVILLPDTLPEQALVIAEQVRAAVEDLRVAHNSSEINDYVTVSLGVATVIPSRDVQPESLIHLADEALYRAKSGGRNRVVAASEISS